MPKSEKGFDASQLDVKERTSRFVATLKLLKEEAQRIDATMDFNEKRQKFFSHGALSDDRAVLLRAVNRKLELALQAYGFEVVTHDMIILLSDLTGQHKPIDSRDI